MGACWPICSSRSSPPKELGRGTGLGLATVYGIVRQSGPRIQVASRPNEGSTFTVYFPRADSPGRSAALLAPAPEPVPGGSETVLVVEDEEIVRHLVCRVLRVKGYRVLEAPHAEAALALADGTDEPIPLLVTDMVMPGLGGPALATRLVANRPGLRVLFITGYAVEAVERRGELADTSGLLEKPFSANQLACKVREVLAGSAGGSRAAAARRYLPAPCFPPRSPSRRPVRSTSPARPPVAAGSSSTRRCRCSSARATRS